MNKKIILASTSPRRKEIMDATGISYDVIPSGYEEQHHLHNDPVEMVEDFAVKKADDVLARYSDAVVIGSDTMVCDASGALLGKPKSYDDAFAMMRSIQGSAVHVYSGVAVLSNLQRDIAHEKAVIQFQKMTDDQIREYLDRPDADWKDKAGAFAVQGTAREWIKEIKGEWEAIVGLPKQKTLKFLQKYL